LPSSFFERFHGVVEAVDPINEDRGRPVKVIREEYRRAITELDHGDARFHRVDCENDFRAKDALEVVEVARHIQARCVDEIE